MGCPRETGTVPPSFLALSRQGSTHHLPSRSVFAILDWQQKELKLLISVVTPWPDFKHYQTM